MRASEKVSRLQTSLITAAVLILLCSCQSPVEPSGRESATRTVEVATASALPTASSEPDLVEMTATPPPAATPALPTASIGSDSEEAAVTPIATLIVPVPRSTATLRPTATITPTPLPTVPPEQIQAILAELGRNDGDCALPCWWGMTPGISRWAEHEPFLSSIAQITKERWYSPQVSYYHIVPNLPETDHSLITGGLVGVLNGVVDSVHTGGTSDVSQLRLPDFLLANGKPDEVWLSTYSSGARGTLPFRLFIAYSRGIVAQFELADVPVISDDVVGCFQRPYLTFLWLVASNRQVTFEEALASGIFSDDQKYLPLQEATGLDIDTFFETFSDSENALCLETPSVLWRY